MTTRWPYRGGVAARTRTHDVDMTFPSPLPPKKMIF
ncbi:MAG: hypothetical protein HW388_1037 [Dehalococcoidia bacterium]|nr:hypothetical protein [Dehalococcoidia bacterium]